MHCDCIGLQVVFPSQSQLRRHEKDSHLNLRPHTCGICAARFDRVSQLSYHQRRIHTGERGHACQICHKVGKIYSEVKLKKHGVSFSSFNSGTILLWLQSAVSSPFRFSYTCPFLWPISLIPKLGAAPHWGKDKATRRRKQVQSK